VFKGVYHQVLSSDLPTIETERLHLRPHTLDDFAQCAAMWADPEVTRYTVGRPLSEEEAWARLLRYVGHWALMNFGYWVVEERSSGNFLGEVGFADLKREIDPSIQGLLEIGWVFAATAHGKGYATEASRAALAWADRHFPSVPIVCIINPENAASIHVADKCGFREYRKSIYKGQPMLMFERENAKMVT
jgi:RimJ/RimL family protein N-acetyltransferase